MLNRVVTAGLPVLVAIAGCFAYDAIFGWNLFNIHPQRTRNAETAEFVLVSIILIISLFFFCRTRSLWSLLLLLGFMPVALITAHKFAFMQIMDRTIVAPDFVRRVGCSPMAHMRQCGSHNPSVCFYTLVFLPCCSLVPDYSCSHTDSLVSI